MAGSRGAVAALASQPAACAAAFQAGLRSCLGRVVAIKARACVCVRGRKGSRARPAATVLLWPWTSFLGGLIWFVTHNDVCRPRWG